MSRSATLDKTFTQADFDAFAALSGDDNPIHVDPDFSARTRFGRTVAHGALLCSVLRGLVEEIVPGGRQIRQSTMYPDRRGVRPHRDRCFGCSLLGFCRIRPGPWD